MRRRMTPSSASSSAWPRTPEARPRAWLKRLEPIGQLALVPLPSSEELDPGQSLVGCDLERVQRVDEPRGVARERRVEREPVDVHAPREGEEVMEGDRPAVECQGHDARDVQLGQPVDDGPMEPHAGRRHEAGTVRPARPTERVKPEGVLERCLQLIRCPGDRHLEPPELAELASSAPVQASRLRRCLRLVDGRPARQELEDRSFDSLDHVQPAPPKRGHDATPGGRPVEVDELMIRRQHLLGQQTGHRVVGIGGQQDIRQNRLAAAHEAHDPGSRLDSDHQWECAQQSTVLPHDVHRERPTVAVVTPPLAEPGVEKERAGSLHGGDEVVPLPFERLERSGARHGLHDRRRAHDRHGLGPSDAPPRRPCATAEAPGRIRR